MVLCFNQKKGKGRFTMKQKVLFLLAGMCLGILDNLEKAARIANIHDYIMGLPLKYNTLIGRDGVGLSQGQKQRILIARAVYKNPDFIFLD